MMSESFEGRASSMSLAIESALRWAARLDLPAERRLACIRMVLAVAYGMRP
jgi:hypothetical protein